MTFDNAAAHADLEFVAETGSAKVGIAELEAVYNRSTAQMSDEALRLSIAQERLNRTIGRSGPESTAAKQATLALRREQAALASEEHRLTTAASGSSRAIQRETHEVGQLTRGAAIGSGVLRGFGRAAVYAGGGLLATAGATRLIKIAISDATNLHAQIHKTRVEFAGSTTDVLRWSKTTAEGIGLARSKSLQFASSIGAVLRPLGILPGQAAEISTSLVQVGGDLAALYNTDVQIPLTALQAALLGQSRGIKKYGVDLNNTRVNELALVQTHKKHTDELTTQEKVLARYTIIMRDTKLAQGQFASTSNTLATQEKILTANLHDTSEAIGTQLYPTVNKLIHRTNDWLGQSKNQQRIQRDVSQAIKDGTQIVHGLADAEKLIAPPIHIAIKALGGLEHAVETALILGLVLKARRGALALGLIQAASTRTRTVIVADAAIEEKALAGVGAVAATTAAEVAAIGGLATGGAVAGGGARAISTAEAAGGGLAAGGALASLLKRGGGKLVRVGGKVGTLAIYLEAANILLGKHTTGKHGLSRYSGTGGYKNALHDIEDLLGFHQAVDDTPQAAPLGFTDVVAAIQQGVLTPARLKTLKGRFSNPGQYEGALFLARQYAATHKPPPGPATGLPSTVSGSVRNPHYLSPAARRDIALHENPNDLVALRAQRAYDDRAVAFLKKRFAAQKVSGADYHDQLIKLTDDRHQQQSQIDQVNQAAAAEEKAAAGKEHQAYLDRLKARETLLRATLRRAVRPAAHGKAEDELTGFYRSEAADLKLTRSRRAGYRKKLEDEQNRDHLDTVRGREATLKNAVLREQTGRKQVRVVIRRGGAGQLTGPSVREVVGAAEREKLIALYRREADDPKLLALKQKEYAHLALTAEADLTKAIEAENSRREKLVIAAKKAFAAKLAGQQALGDAILQNALASAQLSEQQAGTNEAALAKAQARELSVQEGILRQLRAERKTLDKSSAAYQENRQAQTSKRGDITTLRQTIAQRGKQARADQVSLGDQLLQNALSLAQLRETQAGTNAAKIKKAQAAELQVYNAILRRQREHEKGLSGLALAQARADVIATRATIAQLRQQTAAATDSRGENERQFLSSFNEIRSAYAPNAFPRSAAAAGAARAAQRSARQAIRPPATADRSFFADLRAELDLKIRPQAERAPAAQPRSNKTDTHLYELVHESRQTNAHLRVLTGQARTPGSRFASEAALAAFG